FITITSHLPPTTLFPYTTLFRSSLLEVGAVHDARELAQRGVVGAVFRHQRFEGAMAGGVLVRVSGAWSVEADGAGAALDLGHFRDRKSTRLNSSHLGISYAVFCL